MSSHPIHQPIPNVFKQQKQQKYENIDKPEQNGTAVMRKTLNAT
jgi:hypothetical protein